MSRITYLCSSLFLSLFTYFSTGQAFAATEAPAGIVTSAKIKIGVLDVQGSILQTNEGKAAKVKLEKEVEQKKRDLVSQQKALQKLEQDFQSQQAILSDADKLAKQKEFQAKFKAFQTSQMELEQDTRKKELAATNKIYQNLVKIVQDIAAQKGLDMVFDRSAGVLLYSANVTDLTSEVVAAYNNKYHVSSKGTRK